MKKYITIILLAVGVIGIIGINFLGFNEDYEEYGGITNKTETSNYDISEISKKYEFTDVHQNTKPDFRIGEIFEYEQRGAVFMKGASLVFNDSIEAIARLVFKVEGIERINKTDYYIISQAVNNSFSSIDKKGIKHSFKDFLKEKCYISTETGEFLKCDIEVQDISDGMVLPKITQRISIPENMKQIYGNVMYFPWMLSLDEGFKMEINFTDKMGVFKQELEVIGVEMVNKRECFKIKKRLLQDNKVNSIEYLWVDEERRILIKSELYVGNVKGTTTELINGPIY